MNILRRFRRVAAAMTAAFCCLTAFSVQAETFMSVKDVQPGMTGYAKTVAHGRKIETFPVEVLGIMKNAGPSGDLILAKFSGPLIEESGGIAQGMSGSPVYINGKLVGAVAYGWSFTKSRMGMITPIEDMVKLWNDPTKEEIPEFNARETQLVPIATPLMASGFDSLSMQWMKDKLKSYNFQPVDTASAGDDNVAYPLEAGSSVAAAFVDGDMRLGAIGTVTYVDDKHIVAFGHPFLKRGSIDYFMHNAYIFTIVNNYDSSFKLGSVGAEVGKIDQDRGSGIAGEYGAVAPGIPVTIHVSDRDTLAAKTKHVKIIEDSELTPVLASTTVYNTVNQTIDRKGGGTATIAYTIRSADGDDKSITRHNMYYSEDNINEKSIDELYNVLDILKHNEFIKYPILSIESDISLTQAKQSARIVDATAAPVVVSPGDTIYFKVKIHPYRGEDEIKDMSFVVPEDQPLGDMVLEVRGGGVVPLPYLIQKQQYNLTDEILERLRTYKDFADLKKKIEEEDSNNQIVIEILEQNVSMVNDEKSTTAKLKIQGKEPVETDKSLVKPKKKLLSEHDDDDEAKSVVDTPYIIHGDGQITIKVMTPAKRDAEMAKRKKSHSGQVSLVESMDGEDSDVTGKKDDVKARKNGDKNASSHKDKTASDAQKNHGDKDAGPTTDEKDE